jgi:hypothetical protein
MAKMKRNCEKQSSVKLQKMETEMILFQRRRRNGKKKIKL